MEIAMVRQKKENEIRTQFVEHVTHLVDYWYNQKLDTYEKLDGLAFSILSTLDGSDINLPKFIVAPDPHREDMEYNIERGENYFPDNNNSDIKCDISGYLHEVFCSISK